MPAVSVRPQVRYTDSHTRASRRIGSTEEMESLREYIEGQARWKALTLPEGWKRLGQGVSRVAVLSPQGWVWKVPLGTIGSDASQREDVYWQMALRHREFRPHVPHYRVFTLDDEHTLIAMELLEVDRDRALHPETPEQREGVRMVKAMASHIGCEDTHGGNFGWRSKSHPVLLDAGAGTSGRIGKHDGCGTCNEKHYTRKDLR